MSDITTVTLELLRHGPRHNQLLSPLTQYMAVCGNNDPETVILRYEHQQMVVRLRALRYKDSPATREMQLDVIMREMEEILAQIPSLLGELVRAKDSKCRLVHLQVVYSAAELALLPFELAMAPNGFPGAGQPLLLQSETPICLSRKVHGNNTETGNWSREPHIVFAFAAPPGVGPVPYKAHLRALRLAIDPWISHYPGGVTMGKNSTEIDTVRRKQYLRTCVKKYLTVLPDASLDDIRQACEQHNPTIVHILAHGIEMERAGNKRFGLALHDSAQKGGIDVADERRLAEAFRPHLPGYKSGLASPLVVTIASCDSAGQGDITGLGASLAHAIHEKGIPLVLASQFPLTIAGANQLANTVYAKLLWGEDPRYLLSELRRNMKIHSAENHDWASLVAYTALPSDMEIQLRETTANRARESIETALNDIDKLLRDITEELNRMDGILKFIAKIEGAKEHVEGLPGDDIRIQGLLATANKREAQVLEKVRKRQGDDDPLSRQLRADVERLLSKSLEHYEKAFLLDKGSSWPNVQMLALTAYLAKRRGVPMELSLDRWIMAKECAALELRSGDPQTMAWGLGSLCELFILAPLVKDGELMDAGAERGANAMEMAVAHAARMADECTARWRELYSTRRQIERYVDWFQIDAITPLAEAVLDVLPEIPSWK